MESYLYYGVKVLLTALIIIIVTEVAKANAYIGGLIKSLPLISLMAFIWLYAETHDIQRVSELSTSTFWFVLPTLPLFLVLPQLLKMNMGFYLSLILSVIAMLICYGITILILRHFGHTL